MGVGAITHDDTTDQDTRVNKDNYNNNDVDNDFDTSKYHDFEFNNCEFYMALYKLTYKVQFYIAVIVVDIDLKRHLIKIRPASSSYRFITPNQINLPSALIIPDIWIPYLDSNNNINSNHNKKMLHDHDHHYHYYNVNDEQSVLDFRKNNIDFDCLSNSAHFNDSIERVQIKTKEKFSDIFQHFTVYVDSKLLSTGNDRDKIDVDKKKQMAATGTGTSIRFCQGWLPYPFWDKDSISRKVLKDNLKDEYDRRDPEHTIYVKTMEGRVIPILVNDKATVGDLKTIIKYREGLPEKNQALIFCGKGLWPDSKPLLEFNIQRECYVHMVRRLRGAGAGHS